MFLSRISNEKLISLPFLVCRAAVANLADLTDHQWVTAVLEDAHTSWLIVPFHFPRQQWPMKFFSDRITLALTFLLPSSTVKDTVITLGSPLESR